MSRCSKALALNLAYNPALDLAGNLDSMLSSLVSSGCTEVQVNHISKRFPSGYDFSSWKKEWGERTEKVAARGWYSINIPESSVETSAEPSAEPSVEVVTNSTGVVWTPTQTAEDHPIYAEDAGLKRIALMGAKCFGEFVNKGKCKTCPLAGSCQVASFSKIATFAAELDAETEKALSAPEPDAETAPEEADEETSTPESAPSSEESSSPDELKAGWKVMNSVITTICSKCEEPISAGTDCINIRSRGNFHMGCAE